MTTVELKDIPRKDLEIFIYEEHKTAYGTKGRHYDFASMSREELEREADRIADAAEKAYADEKAAEKADLAEFKAQITDVIEAGAGNRITALRWMTSTETFYHLSLIHI